MQNRKRLCAAWFAVYCVGILWLLLGRGMPVWDDYRAQLPAHLNWVPFRTVRLYVRYLINNPRGALTAHAIFNLAGNVVLFVPLGWFLPALFPGLRRFWRTVLTAAGLIAAVEMIQLFTLLGVCDVDDLLLNTLGAAIGFGIYHRLPMHTE